MSAPPTILVFDSGLGGLTVLREIVRARPDAHYVYVADDAFFPYGHHSEDEIIARVVPLIGELIAAHAPDLVVIACNTASTLVMSHLRDAYRCPLSAPCRRSSRPARSSKTKRVSVLGTKGTVKREYTKALIRDFAQGCEVTLVGSAELASLAEAALSGDEVGDREIFGRTRAVFCRRRRRRSGAHRHRRAGLHPLSAADGPAGQARAMAGGLDRSGARDCPAGCGSARARRRRSRSCRRRNDFHLEAAAHAEPGADAVLRRPRPGLTSTSLFSDILPRC